MPVNKNANFPFYNVEKDQQYLALSSVSTSSATKSGLIQISEEPIKVDGAEMLLDLNHRIHADWMLKIWLGGDEAPTAGASGTLKIDLLKGDKISSGDISSPETVSVLAATEATSLSAGQKIFEGLLPDTWKASYLQIQVTVGTAAFTKGKLYAEVYAIERS